MEILIITKSHVVSRAIHRKVCAYAFCVKNEILIKKLHVEYSCS